MNVGLVMVVMVACLALGYRLYGRFVARQVGVDPDRPTPAVTHEDGVDYVPTRGPVLFGQHYASIAAAGPIVGPTLALMWGYMPAWLWIVLGVIFVGAVHDFTALFVTMREGGRSVAEVARKTLGTTGFVLFVGFSLFLCVLVSAAFLDLTAVALTSTWSLADLGLPAGQTLVRVIGTGDTLPNGAVAAAPQAVIGGIASTSVIALTLLAPLVGWLIVRRRVPIKWMSPAALAICLATVWVGFHAPLTVVPSTWILIVAGYTLVAGFVPVWVLLQPRDFVNVHLLYLGLLAMVVGVVACGLAGVTVSGPAFAASGTVGNIGLLWPFLFVTIACGAVSGAHALIAGGTTCKMIASERHCPPIGYGCMLLEGLLAICVTLVLLGGLGYDKYASIVWPRGPGGEFLKGNAPLAFAAGVGGTLQKGLGLPMIYGTLFGILLLEGFLVTTVDTIVRLSRYLVEEIWSVAWPSRPAFFRNRAVNTLVPLVPIVALALAKGYKRIWPIFGSANQLLAALTLIAGALWLHQKAKKTWFAAIPAVFMVVTTMTSIGWLVTRDAGRGDVVLLVVDLALLAMALGVVAITLGRIARFRAARSVDVAAVRE